MCGIIFLTWATGPARAHFKEWMTVTSSVDLSMIGRGAAMKLATTVFILMILPFVTPVVASGQLVTGHLTSDSELIGLVSDTLFVAEGRIGDLGGAATFELDLGRNTSSPHVTAQYAWQSARVEPFSLSYDEFTGLVVFTLGGETLDYYTPYNDFGRVFVRTRASYTDTDVMVDDLFVDGIPVGDYSCAIGPGGLDILWIAGPPLEDGFLITGNATLSWLGAPPTMSHLAFQIKVSHLAAVEAQSVSWAAVKSILR
jgi:hypothetical protein